jgi:hypothetical protein
MKSLLPPFMPTVLASSLDDCDSALFGLPYLADLDAGTLWADFDQLAF